MCVEFKNFNDEDLCQSEPFNRLGYQLKLIQKKELLYFLDRSDDKESIIVKTFNMTTNQLTTHSQTKIDAFEA